MVRRTRRTRWNLPTPYARRSKTDCGFSAFLPHKKCNAVAYMSENIKSEVAKREEETLAFWKEHNIFTKTLAKPSPKGEFVFYEGPPTANGRPRIHHLETRAFKDAIPRFRTMQGYH